MVEHTHKHWSNSHKAHTFYQKQCLVFRVLLLFNCLMVLGCHVSLWYFFFLKVKIMSSFWAIFGSWDMIRFVVLTLRSKPTFLQVAFSSRLVEHKHLTFIICLAHILGKNDQWVYWCCVFYYSQQSNMA